ncbi:MAG: hypothetical protein WCJ97_10710 [Phycisphaerae bacterium]
MKYTYSITDAGRRLLTSDGTKASWNHEYVYPFPIVDVLEYGKSIVCRLDVPPDQICNENVYHVSLQVHNSWQVPKREHAQPWSPYVKIEKSGLTAILHNHDGGVMRTVWGEIIQEYTQQQGPKYKLDSCNITFPNGRTVTCKYDIIQVLEVGKMVILRLMPPSGVMYQQNVVAYNDQGELCWQIPWREVPIQHQHPYGIATLKEGLLTTYNAAGWILHVVPETGEVAKEEYIPW